MKLEEFLNEWRVIKDYAGRGVIASTKSSDFIIWYYLHEPVHKGLLWTKFNGDTYLNDKYLGNVPGGRKTTHKKILATYYDKLGFGKYMSGKLRQDVDDIGEANPRGRIVGVDLYMYADSPPGYDPAKWARTNKLALNAIYKYIPDDYFY